MTAKKPLYQMIVDYFHNEFSSGRLLPGHQLPTELEISAQFDVSRITVIRAFKELEHAGMIYRVKGRGSFVAEGTHGKESALPVLSVVLPYNEQLGYELLTGVEKVCEQAGLYVTFHNSHGDPEREKEIIAKLRHDHVRGIIVYPCSSLMNIELFSDMIIRRFPFVIIDRNIQGLETPLVISNHYQGSYAAAQHLIQLGHRHIAFVGAAMKQFFSISERYRGYCQALIDGGISVKSDWLIDDFWEWPEVRLDKAEDRSAAMSASADIVLKRLLALEQRPTALVVVNDMTAMYMIKAALHMGISIPGELSVTGFDNLSFAEHLEVPLTTVEQNFAAMGERAAEMLVQYKPGNRPVTTILDTALIVRSSTGSPRSS